MTKKSKDVRLKQLMRLGICVALIALIALVGVVMASAEEVKYSEGLKFTSNGDGTCSVSGIGSCTDTEIVIPPVSPSGDRVTRISAWAFVNCSTFTKITFPEGLTEIGSSAFSGCQSLTSVRIPNSVTSIGGNAFNGCLPVMKTQNGLKYVDKWVVGYVSGITEAELRHDTVGIANYAFADCSTLTSITIPDSMTNIGPYAFFGFSGLTDVTIPDSVTSIDSFAFYGCSSLTNITIPESVTRIGSGAFSYCSSLTSITIPRNVTSIDYGSNIFSYCANLSSIKVDDDNPVYHDDGNCVIHTASKELITGCKDSVIPADGSVISIDDFAFYGCTGLMDIEIPDTITNIGMDAFYDCDGLTEIEIPDEVTHMGIFAFANCSNLTTANIPKKETSITWGLFDGCRNLTIIKIPVDSSLEIIAYESLCGISITSLYLPKSIKAIDPSAFYGCSNLTDIYYAGTEDEWKNIKTSLLDDAPGVNLPGINIHYNCSDGLIYRPYGDVYCFVSGISGYEYTDVVIPPISPMGDKVTKIDHGAFYNCSSLKSIQLPKTLTTICGEAFYGCTSLTSITIPEGVNDIMTDAFAGCSSLTDIYLPDSLLSIGEWAFNGCNNLTSIRMPQCACSIDRSAFLHCDKVIEKENGVWYVDNWAIYAEATVTEIDLRPNTVGIACFAFSYLPELTRITMPDTVHNINMLAFNQSNRLTSVVWPVGVTTNAFMGCSSISDIYYTGTQSEWDALEMNDAYSNATIHILGQKTYITGASVSIGESIAINYHVSSEIDPANTVMRFTYGKLGYVSWSVYVEGVYSEQYGEYIFSLTELPPHFMHSDIKAELILLGENGENHIIGVKAKYSIRQYCDDALAADPNNTALAILLADLLAYGDASQKYIVYQTYNFVSDGFPVAPSEWEDVTDTDFTLSDKTRDDIRFTAAGVRFAYVNRLYFKLKAADLTGVTVTVNGKTYTADELELVEDTDNTYILYTDAIYATEFDKIFTAELSVDGDVIQTLTYSVKSYVYAKQNTENDKMAALARALYNYGRSAVAYKNAQ